MKKILLFSTLVLSSIAFANTISIQPKETSIMTDNNKDKKNIYQFKVLDINGEEFDFASLKGKKIMIVNTASECGLTPQYKQLQALYNEFEDQNFVIVGFPANNFGSQEPGSDAEIATFCEQNFGVSFPMMSKISVKGKDMAPIYAFLTEKAKNGVTDSSVSWNFQKYLINEQGQLDKVIDPRTTPDAAEIRTWILNKN